MPLGTRMIEAASAPPPLMAALALGTLVGAGGPLHLARCAGAFILSVMAGAALGLVAGSPPHAGLLLTLAVLCATLATLRDAAFPSFSLFLSCATGLLVGAGPPILAGSDPAVALSPAVASALMLLIGGGSASLLRRSGAPFWSTLGARIGSAWIAAIAFMLLAVELSAP